MTHIAAGDLTTPVVFLRFDETARNAFNEEIGAWAELERAWAKVRDLSDAEKIAAGDQVGVLKTRFVIRWTSGLSDLNNRDRVAINGVDFNIIGCKTAGEPLDRMMEITAERRSDEG